MGTDSKRGRSPLHDKSEVHSEDTCLLLSTLRAIGSPSGVVTVSCAWIPPGGEYLACEQFLGFSHPQSCLQCFIAPGRVGKKCVVVDAPGKRQKRSRARSLSPCLKRVGGRL